LPAQARLCLLRADCQAKTVVVLQRTVMSRAVVSDCGESPLASVA